MDCHFSFHKRFFDAATNEHGVWKKEKKHQCLPFNYPDKFALWIPPGCITGMKINAWQNLCYLPLLNPHGGNNQTRRHTTNVDGETLQRCKALWMMHTWRYLHFSSWWNDALLSCRKKVSLFCLPQKYLSRVTSNCFHAWIFDWQIMKEVCVCLCYLVFFSKFSWSQVVDRQAVTVTHIPERVCVCVCVCKTERVHGWKWITEGNADSPRPNFKCKLLLKVLMGIFAL